MSARKGGLILLIALSAVGAVPLGQASATPLGILLALLSTVASAKLSLSALLMSGAAQNGLTPVVMVWYDALLSLGFLLLTALVTGELSGALAAYLEARPLVGATALLAGGMLALAYNLVHFTLTKTTSSVTNSIVGNVNKVLIITLSAAFLDHTSGARQWVCTAVFFGATAAYSYATITARSAPAPQPPGAPPVWRSATERTPLNAPSPARPTTGGSAAASPHSAATTSMSCDRVRV